MSHSGRGARRVDAKRDENEPEIIEGLEAAGFTIARISEKGVPDLLVGGEYSFCCPDCQAVLYWRGNMLIEVKMPKAQLTDPQVEFHGGWRGQIAIAHSIEEALKIVGR